MSRCRVPASLLEVNVLPLMRFLVRRATGYWRQHAGCTPAIYAGRNFFTIASILMPAAKPTAKRKRAPARRKTPKKAAPRTRGIQPSECSHRNHVQRGCRSRATRVVDEGGHVIGCYIEPLGGNPLLLAALPIDRVEPTPFQRDLSDAHLQEALRRHRQDGTCSWIPSLPSPPRRKVSGRPMVAIDWRQCDDSAQKQSSRYSCPSERSPGKSSH